MLKSRNQVKIVLIFLFAAGMTVACSKKGIEIETLSKSNAMESVQEKAGEMAQDSVDAVDAVQEDLEEKKKDIEKKLEESSESIEK